MPRPKSSESSKKQEEKLETKVLPKVENKVDLQNPPFDPDIPEQKQRWFR